MQLVVRTGNVEHWWSVGVVFTASTGALDNWGDGSSQVHDREDRVGNADGEGHHNTTSKLLFLHVQSIK